MVTKNQEVKPKEKPAPAPKWKHFNNTAFFNYRSKFTMKKPKIVISAAIILLFLTFCQGQETEEDPLELEYRRLYALTDDKTGLESIRVLHKQLDDDNDGTIEPAETCDFIRADLVRINN